MIKRISFLILATAIFSLHAAPPPDSVWRTNSNFSFISSIRFRPDNSSVAAGCYSGPARLWSTTNGTLLRTFNYSGLDIVAVAFSPDGTLIFGGAGTGPYRIWQVSDGVAVYSNPAASVGFGVVTYSPNGLYRALGRHRRLTLQDNQTGDGIFNFGDEPHGSSGWPHPVEFSPDSTLLGSSGDDNTAKLWRVSDGALLQNFQDRGGAIAFTPDGKYFCYDNHEGGANFWDVQTNGVGRVFPAWGSAVRFTPDGKLLLTVNGSLINFWRVATGTLLASYDTAPDGNALSVDISPNGKLFAYGSYNGTVVLARMPLCVESITRNGNEVILKWQGGSGLYQLQSNTNFTRNGWQNVGAPTTNTCATNVSSSTLFFRVQSLPNS